MRAAISLLLLVGLASAETPVEKVIKLIEGIKSKVEAEGAQEQTEYDKFACWVEETLKTKAGNIKTAENDLDNLQRSIEEGTGSVASLTAQAADLEKRLGETEASKADTEGNCKQARAAYDKDIADKENAMGALEQAIFAITGAGTGKKSFLGLGALQEAKMLSVVGDVRAVFSRPAILAAASPEDLETVRQFVAKPRDFLDDSRSVSAAQVGQNPFGDYAPKSDRISGLFKGMYDGMAEALEKADVDQANKQKSCEEFIATKNQEITTLKETLFNTKVDLGKAEMQLADDKDVRQRTQEALAADEEFFDQTKDNAEEKAQVFNDRVQKRHQELTDIGKALNILTEGKAALMKDTVTFLQLRSHSDDFTKTINTAIDKMLATLQAEADKDIAMRDECQSKISKNQMDIDDSAHAKERAIAEIERLTEEIEHLTAAIEEEGQQIKDTETEIADMLKTRNEEVQAFKTALKDNTVALDILQRATAALKDSTKAGLLQHRQSPPRTSFDDKSSYSTSGASSGVVGMMEGIMEDVKMQIKTMKAEAQEDEVKYDKMAGAAQSALQKSKKVKARMEREKQDAREAKEAQENARDNSGNDRKALEEEKTAIAHTCSWIKDGTFEQRKSARETEMAGLREAKANMAGALTNGELKRMP